MSGHRTVAPCGTKPARDRHRRRGETCQACARKARPLKPCGTAAAYKRGCRCEPCTIGNRDYQRTKTQARTRTTKQRTISPCGTRAARRRHARYGETCADCQPKTIQPLPCGTPAAYKRGCHCQQCRQAIAAYRTQHRTKRPSDQGKISVERTQAIIEEIEFFLQCGEGEHAILKALNTTQPTLQRRLHRAKRADLMPRIFAYMPNEYVRRAA